MHNMLRKTENKDGLNITMKRNKGEFYSFCYIHDRYYSCSSFLKADNTC